MSLADLVLALLLAGLTLYTLTGGADFGAGFWDLVAGGTRRGWPQRRFIERTIAPIWEANHVWLIFAFVMLWTAFPAAFASIASTLVVPLTLAAIGIILRGAAFAFRSAVPELREKRVFGAAFALSSLFTPFFLGASAAAIASGRVPPGNAAGDVIGSWWNPTGVYGGLLGIGLCAYLAAVYLTRDAEREGEGELARGFRRRALICGVVVGAVALGGLLVVRADAPALYAALIADAPLFIAASIVAGLGSLALVAGRRFVLARVAAVVAVSSILLGWATAQYPYVLPGALTVREAAAPAASLGAVLVSLAIGFALLLPSLWLLFRLFQRPAERP